MGNGESPTEYEFIHQLLGLAHAHCTLYIENAQKSPINRKKEHFLQLAV